MARRTTLLLALTVALLPAATAEAARAPTKAEAKAIKKGFLKGRSKAATTIRRVRVSTVSARYAAVTYRTAVKTSTVFAPPTPVVLKKSGKKWKPVTAAKAPAKVKKDLKVKPALSDVRLSGEVAARFTRPARCGSGGVTIYDRGADLLLSIQQSRDQGLGLRDALGVRTVVAVYRASGTALAYESGQPADASASSGVFYRDAIGGFVNASLAPPPVPEIRPFAVEVKGDWVCG